MYRGLCPRTVPLPLFVNLYPRFLNLDWAKTCSSGSSLGLGTTLYPLVLFVLVFFVDQNVIDVGKINDNPRLGGIDLPPPSLFIISVIVTTELDKYLQHIPRV